MIYSEDVIEEIHDCGNWKFKFYLLINKYWEGVKSMQIKKLRVTNVASLVDFHNDTAFEKNNIIFGTNGSGKSTLVELLHLLNKYHLHKDAETETELKDFLRGRFSKESISDTINIELYINSNKALVAYNKNSDSLKFSNNVWTPIKVFNEHYTNRTIGDKFEMDLQNSSIAIGEKNIELEKAYTKKRELKGQYEKYISKANEIVDVTIKKYRAATKSSTNVSDKICIETIPKEKCDFKYDPILLENRNKLGFGNIETSLTKLDVNQLMIRIDRDSIEKSCNEKISPPVITGDIETLLKNYTDFYNKGLEVYENCKKEVCPFCQRDWLNAEEMITKYKSFMKSTYNIKRKAILDAIKQLEGYKDQVKNYIYVVDGRRKLTEEEAKKYNVETKDWKPLQYYIEKHNEIIEILRKKHDQMDLQVSVKNQINELQNYHLDIIQNNNRIIDKVLREISVITSRRKELNKKLVDHFAKEMWSNNSSLREDINQNKDLLRKIEEKIEKLEKENPPQDVIREIFNGLLNLIGLCEYSIDKDNRLNLIVDKDYDISNEGKRISSAQRKILSLCYFFAEIVSEIKDIKDLINYILVFDDPVDSADYIYFHSITTVIEKAETILASILGMDNIKFGQIFVLTHNSLLHDRLCCAWRIKSRAIKKENSVTIMCDAGKTINNYNEYISDICRYYKNPVSQKRQMIYIGNLIRRVLEIIASFDTLESNSIGNILNGMGKIKLALLANHLSHESFSKVLNPLSSPEELKEACYELFEVIKERHPAQFNTINERYELQL